MSLMIELENPQIEPVEELETYGKYEASPLPAGYGGTTADAIMAAGQSAGICAYGVEALNVLRIEKGHVTNAEINGTVTPDDLGEAILQRASFGREIVIAVLINGIGVGQPVENRPEFVLE